MASITGRNSSRVKERRASTACACGSSGLGPPDQQTPTQGTNVEGLVKSVLNLAGSGLRLTQQTIPPTPEQGEVGEVRWVDDGKDSALWVKTPNGWKKSKLD